METNYVKLFTGSQDNERVIVPTHVLENHSEWRKLHPGGVNFIDGRWEDNFTDIVQIAEDIVVVFWRDTGDIERYGTCTIYKCSEIKI